MEYTQTFERQSFLDARGYTILMACPGSGKTTSIAFKMKSIIDELQHATNGYGGLACLSFTNVACDEYRSKFNELHESTLSFPHTISTIDSFITQNIVLPFAYLFGCPAKIRILNDNEELANVYKQTYIQDGERKEAIVPPLRRFGRLAHTKRPEFCSIDLDGYKWNGSLIEADNERNYAKACIRWRFEKGIITSQDALYIACCILRYNEDIARALAKRFPYIIIDEAQDTSALQMKFFELLRTHGVQNMEFVGDLSQSIYGWNNAKPELLETLSHQDDFSVLHFTECRRSVQPIIDIYSKLKIVGEPRIVSTGVENKNCPIIVYRYDENGEIDVMRQFVRKCEEFELKDKLILARGKDEVNKLSGGKSRIDLWKSSVPYNLINSKIAYDDGKYSEAIRFLRYVWTDCLFDKYAYEEKKQFLSSLENDVDSNCQLLDLIQALPSLHKSFSEWQDESENLLQEKLNLEHRPDFDRKSRLVGQTMRELLNENVDNYFGIVEDATDYRNNVETIHLAKGASVDAVLLFLSTDNRGANISLNLFPDQGQHVNEMTEKHRLVYVACSRAKQFLAFAVRSDVTEETIRQKLGEHVTIISNGIQLGLF